MPEILAYPDADLRGKLSCNTEKTKLAKWVGKGEPKPAVVWQLAPLACLLVSSKRPWRALMLFYSQFSQSRTSTKSDPVLSENLNQRLSTCAMSLFFLPVWFFRVQKAQNNSELDSSSLEKAREREKARKAKINNNNV